MEVAVLSTEVVRNSEDRMGDFNLLSYLGVHDTGVPLTAADRDDEERRRRAAFDEYQYRAHNESEAKRKARLEANATGRACRYEHQMRDQRHHYRNFWFGGGEEPESVVVGSSAREKRPVVFTMDGKNNLGGGGGASTPRSGGGGGRAEVLSEAQSQWRFRTHAPPSVVDDPSRRAFVVLRSKTPPPSPASVAARLGNGETARGDYTVALRDGSRIGPDGARPVSPTNAKPSPHASPYAEHYDLDVAARSAAATSGGAGGGGTPRYHLDRNGLPRGADGVDAEEGRAREAQRVAEELRRQAVLDHKREQQRRMREDLDELTRIKRLQKREDRELDNQTVFGFSLPIPETDPRATKTAKQRQRMAAEATWAAQADEARRRREAEDEYYKQDRSMYWVGQPTAAASAHVAAAAEARDAKDAWKRAWQEHQVAEGAAQRAAEQARIREEEMRLSPAVASYGERLLAAEELRRRQRAAYKAELDEQVRRQEYDPSRRIVDNFTREKRFHRPPFSVTPRSL